MVFEIGVAVLVGAPQTQRGGNGSRYTKEKKRIRLSSGESFACLGCRRCERELEGRDLIPCLALDLELQS